MIDRDIIAGLVSTIGGCLVWSNVYRLWRDKEVKGANLLPALYFTCGGAWQVYFLFSLHQVFAPIGGFIIATGNLMWVALAAYYRYRRISNGSK